MPLVAAVPPAPTDLAWRVIGLVNLYRLLIPPALYALYAFGGADASIGTERPELFLWTCMVYFAAGIAIVIGGRRLLPNLRATTFVHAMVDAVAISLLMFSSGGVASGLGILFVVPVGAMALLADSRDAFVLAALATLALLAQQIGGQVTRTAAVFRPHRCRHPRRHRVPGGAARLAGGPPPARHRSHGAPPAGRSRQPRAAVAVHRADTCARASWWSTTRIASA